MQPAAGRRQRRTGVQTAVLLLLGLAMTGTAAATAYWHAHAGAAPADFDLLADASSPTLSSTSAEAPPPLSAPTPQADLDKANLPPLPVATVEPPVQVLETKPPEPVAFVPPAEPARLSAAVEALDGLPPAATSSFARYLAPGDSTMMRNWRSLGLQIVLVSAVAAAPVVAAPEDKDSGPATAKDVKDIKDILKGMDQAIGKDIDALKKNVELLTQKTQGDVENLRKELTALRLEVEALKKAPSTSSSGPAAREVEDLKKQLERLQLSVEALRGTRISAFPPAATTGRLRLVNEYPQPMDILVNQLVYTLRPFETRELSLPAGNFSYRVPSAQPGDQARVLTANETFTVTVYQR